MKNAMILVLATISSVAAVAMLVGMMTREWGFAGGGLVVMTYFGMLTCMVEDI